MTGIEPAASEAAIAASVRTGRGTGARKWMTSLQSVTERPPAPAAAATPQPAAAEAQVQRNAEPGGSPFAGGGGSQNPKKRKGRKSAVAALVGMRVGIAVAGGAVVGAALAAINPPIVQSKSEKPGERGKRSPKKIAIVAAVAAALCLLLPAASAAYKSSSKASGAPALGAAAVPGGG